MRHYPVFLDMDRARIVLSGGGEAALAKLRLLLKTRAMLIVHARDPLPELRTWAEEGLLRLIEAPLNHVAVTGATLVYAADEDAAEDARTYALAHAQGILCNIVDDLAGSDFITPAMVERAPLTVAIGTEGTAPMLARSIKADLEQRLPKELSALTEAARDFRPRAATLPQGRVRRTFWSDWFGSVGAAALETGQDLNAALEALLADHAGTGATRGRITLTFTGSPDPELLTLKARKAIDLADVVIHAAGIAPAILELARREARFVTLADTPEALAPLHQQLPEMAAQGEHVLVIDAAPLPDTLIAACHDSGQPFDLIPGIAAPQAAQWKETA